MKSNSKLSKPVTESDRKKLGKGREISREILLQAGVVNLDQDAEISRLFVSDSRVFPKPLGKPPVLTIVALSKRFSKRLASQYLKVKKASQTE